MPTWLASRLIIDHLRFRVQNEWILRRGLMEGKLKLTGLTKLAMDARASIDGMTADYRAFNAKAGAHRADIQGLTEQIGEMDADLSSSVNILGNSVAASNNGGQQGSGAEKQVITPAEVGEVPADVLEPKQPLANPAPPQAQQAAIQPPHVDMHPAPSASNWVPPR